MICGIVDLGSNTIRLSIYRCEGLSGQRLMNRKVMAGLASYVEDGKMPPSGVEVICKNLIGFRSLMDNLNIEPMYVFATASLRNVSNTKEVVKAIKKETGIRIDVLSGQEEGVLSFYGALQGISHRTGLLIDLGGGSTELVQYRKGKFLSAHSLPIGSLTMFNRYVENLHPTVAERKAIRNEVHLQMMHNQIVLPKISHVCGVGGTARAVCTLANRVFKRPDTCRTLSMEEIRALLKEMKRMDRKTLNMLLKAAPDRVHTLQPGLLILDTICRTCHAKEIEVSTNGVREGYLYKKILEPMHQNNSSTAKE